MNHLADTIGSILGKPVHKEHTAPRTGDIRDSWADITAAREALGWEPTVGLEEGLRLTADALLLGRRRGGALLVAQVLVDERDRHAAFADGGSDALHGPERTSPHAKIPGTLVSSR